MSGNSKSKQHQLKIGQLLTDLRSGDDLKVGAAIKSFHVHGDESVIAPLVEVWRGGLSDENTAAMMELFEGLKDSSTVEPLMEAFRDEVNAPIKRQLIGAFWNSKLDFSAYLSDFVLFAIDGDFLDAFEAITLIEQFETLVPESAIMESQLLLKEYFGGTENRNEQKDTIMGDIALMVKQFDAESDSEDLYLD
ncbi:MAG: hypothetical protein A3D31_11175 [Candidatus Fluviicola riflensis]|nr:MAG: hypothetical protein CHH17_15595 [Candidatus Fluviicola riflensis]OGS77552.1 MAG: hypothetical protein A3D31_11175 [Candidatus Fluviicola riflensis]OGS84618.1 MAG: hypothetical protein A2724_08110 [Fluviicola sp. RIFCSPHIGHO2_01_FULL_43_53]